MPGRKARIVRCIDLALTSKEKSQSSSVVVSTVPWWTKPAQLKRMSTGPYFLAIASTASVERTSSPSVTATPWSLRSAISSGLRSVAITSAPSRAKASAVARPIPAPAAVRNARLPLSRSMSFPFPLFEPTNPRGTMHSGGGVVNAGEAPSAKMSRPANFNAADRPRPVSCSSDRCHTRGLNRRHDSIAAVRGSSRGFTRMVNVVRGSVLAMMFALMIGAIVAYFTPADSASMADEPSRPPGRDPRGDRGLFRRA